MKKEKNEGIIAITYVLVMAIFIGFFALVSYLFQACWNLGLVKAFSTNEIDFQSATYLIGLISLVGFVFRGWGLDKFQASSKEKNLENK